MARDRLTLFALGATRELGTRMGGRLGVALGEHEERDFEDGEHKARPLESVRGADAFVVQSLHSDPDASVNDKLVKLLFFIGALKDASAERVTAVIPYLCYARKDRKTQTRDPVSSRYTAAVLEAAGADRVLALEVHNIAAFQNAFRIPTDHLEAYRLFVDHFAARLDDTDVTVVSPDVGGIKRAERFREALARRLGRPPGAAFMEKQRAGGVVSGEALVGEVEGKTVIIVDDLISSGTTIARAARACRAAGAAAVHGAAAHGLFVGGANEAVADPALDTLVVTDTVPAFRLEPKIRERKLVVLDAARLLADAVAAIHSGGSIVDLMQT